MLTIQLKRQGQKKFQVFPSMPPSLLKAYLKMLQGMNIRPGTMQMRIINTGSSSKKEIILIDAKIIIDPLVSPKWKAPQPVSEFAPMVLETLRHLPKGKKKR